MNTLTDLLQPTVETDDTQALRAPLARKKQRSGSGQTLAPLSTNAAGELFQETPPAKLPAAINDQGLLSKADADKDIVVEIPYEDYFGPGDSVTLYLNNTEYVVAPISETDATPWMTRTLPNSGASLIAEGRYTVTYKVEDFAGTPFDGVHAQPLRIDRTAPGGVDLPLIEFDADAVEHGVTVHSLMNGFLVATVPAWFDEEEGDVIKPYYQLIDAGTEFAIAEADTEVPPGGAGQHIEVKIPEARLRLIGDKQVWFGIWLQDAAGNISAGRSQRIPLTLILEGAPVDADLTEPLIALFDDDGLIDEADARHPVEVKIPGFDKARGGDTIVFYLGATHTQPIPIDDSETALDPILTFDLAYQLFVDAGAGNQQYDAEAYYELYRGTALLATSPRPNAIAVDITTPGGTDPDPETPENENLRLATAKGASGRDNYISQDDILEDATVFVPWFARDAEDANVDYLAEGDIVSVIWGSLTLADTHTVSATDVTSQTPLELTATPAEMASGGVGHIAVSYTVSREVAAGLVNESLSPAQSVEVISTALLPGGPGGLPAGTFTEANAQNALNKELVQSGGGTPFRVLLDYANVAVDDEITLVLQGYYALDGSGSTTPNTELTLRYTLVTADLPDPTGGPAKFHDFLIETAYFSGKWDVLPIGRGSVTANYTIENRFGIANAARQLVRVAVTDL